MLKIVTSEENPSTEGSFDTFWKIYPRKVAKVEAEKSWKKLRYEDKARAISSLPNHIAEWADRGDPRFVPHASTWLNQRRFEDELEIALEIKPCKWPGCKKHGTNVKGTAQYCDHHLMALKRGETP
jgi:hypothetical protein